MPKLLEVFDPAMCCSTGVCGPQVDPKLVHFAADLDWLKSRGLDVRRYNLARQPAEFARNAAVAKLLADAGTAALPALLVDGVLVSQGRYPDRAELAALGGLKPTPQPAEAPAPGGGCGCGGRGARVGVKVHIAAPRSCGGG